MREYEKEASTRLPNKRLAGLRPSLVLAAMMILVLSGFTLIIIGSFENENTTGCFLWPFPLIVACGFGSISSTVPVLLIITLVGFGILFLWMTGGTKGTKLL